MKIFIIIFLLIIITPLPLKLSINLINKKYYIKFYNHTIINNTKKKKSSNKYKEKHKYNKAIKALSHNKYKPFILLKGTISYSLNNPMFTAISYGICNIVTNFAFILFDTFFNTKKYNIIVNPSYKEEYFISLRFNCIIFASIGQIIYMLLIFNKNIEKVANYD